MTLPSLGRRRLLLAGTAAILARSARSAELEKVRVSIIPINDVTPLFAAIRNGYFRDEGLDIDTTPSSGGATGIPGMIAGSFNIVYGNVVSTMLAAQQGIDIKVVAPGTKTISAETDVAEMVVRADSGIRTGRDLEGKSVGVNTRNNVIWLYARAWIRKTGGDPDRVTYREINHPQMEDALRQKQIDASFMVVPFVTVALGKPEFLSIGKPYSDVQPGVDVGQYLSTGTYLREKSATVETFVRGLRRGIAWYNANRENPEVLDIISGFTRVDVALLKLVKLSPAPLRTDPPEMEKTMRLMIENKLLKGPVDVARIVAPTAL